MPTCALLPAEGVIREGIVHAWRERRERRRWRKKRELTGGRTLYTFMYIYINVHPIHACIHRHNVTEVKFVSGKKKEK